MSSRKMDSQLESARIAIVGAQQHPEIKKLLGRVGYHDKKMDEGTSLIADIKQYGVQKTESYGLQKAATARYRQEKDQLTLLYQEHLSLARVALKDDIAAGDVLHLWGPRLRDAAGWLAQVSAFYANAARYSETLGKYTIAPAAIAQGQAMVKAIEETRIQQARSRSDAQVATQRRRQAFNELQAWMREFRAIAKIALKDEPQYLEALGQVVK